MNEGSGLLQKLASGIRPAGPERAVTPALREVAGPGFAELLAKAGQGEITSGLPVTIARNAGVELSAEQLARVGVAADRAQAAGADRAIVLIDGAALKLDVATRTISGPADLAPGAVHGDIDALVVAAGPATAAAGPVPPGAGGATLLKALAPIARDDKQR